MRDLQTLQCLPAAAAGEPAARSRAATMPARSAPSARTPRAANEPLVDDPAGWARHARAANGFGDAEVVEVHVGADASPAPSAMPPARPVADVGGLPHAIAGLVAAMHEALAAWRRHRAARVTEVALHELDDRALRDLGLDPSEIRSVAGEVAGLADRTRAHAAHALCHRLF